MLYRLTITGHSYMGQPTAPQVLTMALSPEALLAKTARIESCGLSVESTMVSTSLDCAGCGHRWSDHFQGTGLCDLGFCRSGCTEFVVTL